MQQIKDVSCCCFIKGSVEATIRMNKRCFVPGETLRITGLVVNHSSTKIKSVTATLVQVFVYKFLQNFIQELAMQCFVM